MNRHTDRTGKNAPHAEWRSEDPAAPGMDAYHAALDRTRRSRALRRRLAGGAGIAGTAVLALMWMLMPTAPGTPGAHPGAPPVADGPGAMATLATSNDAAHDESPSPAHAAPPRTTIITGAPVRRAEVVRNLPSERLETLTIARGTPHAVPSATDAQLIATFDQLGQPVGIIRFEGRATLARLDVPPTNERGPTR